MKVRASCPPKARVTIEALSGVFPLQGVIRFAPGGPGSTRWPQHSAAAATCTSPDAAWAWPKSARKCGVPPSPRLKPGFFPCSSTRTAST